MAFNPNEHIIQLQNKDYLEVKWRLVWFRDLCPNGTIETEMLHLDLDREITAEVWVWNNETRRREKVLKTAKGYCVFRAIIKDGKGGVGTGTKSESAVDFADFIEKSESGSIGRALATLGYGTQFTGDEMEEGSRIVDSPVDRGTPECSAQQNTNTAPRSQTGTSKTAERSTQTSNVPMQDTQSTKISRAVSNVSQVPPVVRDLKSRAVDLGIVHNLAEWMAYKKQLIGHDVKDADLQEAQINTLGRDIDRVEQASKAS